MLTLIIHIKTSYYARFISFFVDFKADNSFFYSFIILFAVKTGVFSNSALQVFFLSLKRGWLFAQSSCCHV